MSNDNNFARGQRSESGEKIKVPPGGQGSLSPPKMLSTHSLTKKKNREPPKMLFTHSLTKKKKNDAFVDR